jgi:hypothetical protein
VTMTETRNETQIIVNEDVRMVTIIREFDAPPEKVFRAGEPAVMKDELLGDWVVARVVAQERARQGECASGDTDVVPHAVEDGDAVDHHPQPTSLRGIRLWGLARTSAVRAGRGVPVISARRSGTSWRLSRASRIDFPRLSPCPSERRNETTWSR